MPGMEVYGAEERKEVMDVLETGALFRYGHEHIRKGMWMWQGWVGGAIVDQTLELFHVGQPPISCRRSVR
jgi:hypothetical protein